MDRRRSRKCPTWNGFDNNNCLPRFGPLQLLTRYFLDIFIGADVGFSLQKTLIFFLSSSNFQSQSFPFLLDTVISRCLAPEINH